MPSLLEKVKVWKISPGRKGKHWEDPFRKSSVIALDSGSEGRLDRFRSKQELRNALNKSFGAGPRCVNYYWKFVKEDLINDVVIAYSNSSIYDIGIIVGGYEYDEGSKDYKHRRKTRWLGIVQSPIQVTDKIILHNMETRYQVAFAELDELTIRRIGAIVEENIESHRLSKLITELENCVRKRNTETI